MKIAIITQARVDSTRLPGKVLMKIMQKTILEYHIERLKWSSLHIVVATTNKGSDDSIVSLCNDMEIPFFRGSEEDVLARYYECAKTNCLDVVIRVTSDCPLIDGYLIKEALKTFIMKRPDYLSNIIERSFPRGLGFEIFTFKSLETAFVNAREKPEREHVTPYIWRNNSQHFKLAKFKHECNKSAYRIAIDTSEDFLVVKKLIEEHQADKKGYRDIISILDNNPEILDLNKAVKQKKYGE